MRIRVKKNNPDNVVRLETFGDIKDILINEDFVNPDNESISICFRGKNTSGIVDFRPSELESVYMSVKSRMGLVKAAGKLDKSRK
jgi:hypothetical protein